MLIVLHILLSGDNRPACNRYPQLRPHFSEQTQKRVTNGLIAIPVRWRVWPTCVVNVCGSVLNAAANSPYL